MNKTINANIGGFVFTIDEDAYQELYRYLDKLRAYFTQTDVSTDIIEDIEARIAEILQGRLAGKRSIVNTADIDAVMATMGKPEDFAADGATEEPSSPGDSTNTFYVGKRFFRNPDDRVVGGVASGLGAYFNIDPLWFRVLFALSIVFWGTGVLIYIILWIILPEANSTTEKMQMRGEPITISNIEKSVREQLDEMGQRVKGFAKENFTESERVKQASDSLVKGVGSVNNGLAQMLKFIGKIIGIGFIIIGMVILGSLLLALFTTSTVFSISLPFLQETIFSNNTQSFLLSVGIILVTIVPILWMIVGIVLWLLKVRQGKRWIHLSFLAVFLISLGMTIAGGVLIGTDFRVNGVVSAKEELPQVASDTLWIKLSDHDYLWEQENHFFELEEQQLRIGYVDLQASIDSLHFTNVIIKTAPATDSLFHVSQYRYARGPQGISARQRARAIAHEYKVVGNALYIDPAFQIGDHPWRNQHVKVLVSVPPGKVALFDPALSTIAAAKEDAWD